MTANVGEEWKKSDPLAFADHRNRMDLELIRLMARGADQIYK